MGCDLATLRPSHGRIIVLDTCLLIFGTRGSRVGSDGWHGQFTRHIPFMPQSHSDKAIDAFSPTSNGLKRAMVD